MEDTAVRLALKVKQMEGAFLLMQDVYNAIMAECGCESIADVPDIIRTLKAERDSAYWAIMLIERGASGPLKKVCEAIPEVEAAFQAARKMGDE